MYATVKVNPTSNPRLENAQDLDRIMYHFLRIKVKAQKLTQLLSYTTLTAAILAPA
jgi:hypothetical protein